ncbi:MAG: hypothetical protein ACK526_06510 [Planctomyces sp.]
MKYISMVGWMYLALGVITCGSFTAACVGRWRPPDFSAMSDNGSSGSGGTYWGRPSGGFWGGGK